MVRSWRRYRHVFFMLHDLGDVDVYQREKMRLQEFNALLVPNPLHAARARAALGSGENIIEVGWPKLDTVPMSGEHAATLALVRRLPRDVPTIMYAPNCPGEEEWDNLWAVLRNLPVNIIIKNATYEVGSGESLPLHYERIIQTIDRMECEVRQSRKENIVVTPRDLNICVLFPFVSMLISAKSSVLAEFVPFGVSVETDVPWPPELHSALISRDYTDIVFMKKEELYEVLSAPDRLRRLIGNRIIPLQQPEAACRYPNEMMLAGQRAAEVINSYLTPGLPLGRAWRRVYAAARV